MLKNKILSFVRRLSGAERNFHKIIELERQIKELSNSLILNLQKNEERESILFEKMEKCIHERIGSTEWHINRNYEAIKDVLYSMISIASASKKTSLFLPDGTQHLYDVEKEANGGICFRSTEGNGRPPVFIVTLPKSGTYFLGKIIEELGYANVHIHSGRDAFHDYRNRNLKEQMDSYLNFSVMLPYILQIQLVRSGQYLLGHLPYECAPLLESKSLFLMIRDMRYVLLSALRFLQRREYYKNRNWFYRGNTEEALFLFMCDDSAKQFIQSGIQMIEWCKLRPASVIRYEYIIDETNEYFLTTVKRLADMLAIPYTEVLSARERAAGQQTHSYSGKPSQLAGIWSDRIEEKFHELGGEKINYELGYCTGWMDTVQRERERERVKL